MRAAVRGAAVAGVLAVALSAGLPATASAAGRPGAVTSVDASPGARAGEITVRWRASGARTDQFRIETSLTPFFASGEGRPTTTFTVKGSKRSFTLRAATVRTAGAAPATGNHLYVRVVPVDLTRSGARTGPASALVATTARAVPPPAVGSPLRIASYNVRSAKYDSEDRRPWSVRADGVAADIVRMAPGIVAVQEASPGLFGALRQTESLQAALVRADPTLARYTMTRTTVYSPPGTLHGSQAARIVYDASRYQLLTPCTDVTVVDDVPQPWSSSCSFDLPVLPDDAPTWRRSAAYAEFLDLASGRTFLVVSAHLDYRHSKDPVQEARFNELRRVQAATIWANMNLIRKPDEPVVVAGDFNSSQADRGGNAPHDYLVSQGFYDAAGAQKQVNLDLPSLNHFDTVLTRDPQGYARRVDQILVYGTVGSKRFAQVVKQRDSARSSDHNLVYADVVIPTY